MRAPMLRWRVLVLTLLFATWFGGTAVWMADATDRWAITEVTSCATFALYLLYWVISGRAYTVPGTTNAPAQTPPTAELSSRVTELFDDFDLVQAAFYVQMILAPKAYTVRIGERIVPATRSYEVTTAYSIIAPKAVVGKTAAVPVLLVAKGQLLDRFSIHDGRGDRCPTLSQDQAIVHTAAAIRRLVAKSGPNVLADYRSTTESQLIGVLARPDAISDDDGTYADLIQLVRDLVQRGLDRRTGQVVITVLNGLKRHYPVVVVEPAVPSPDASHLGGGLRLRFKVERRLIPIPNFKVGRLERAIEYVRAMLGVNSARILWPLTNSAFARSYHLETSGPAGTYLARQAIINSYTGLRENALAVQQRVLSRRGQRYGHLYIHGRNESPPRPLTYVAVFYERPPGSAAPATLSAFVSLALLVVASLARQTQQLDIPTDLVAVLLAVPAIASAWAGFDSSKGVFGGVLSSKVSQIFTMLLSLFGAAWYIEGPHPSQSDFHEYWLNRPGSEIWVLIVSASLYAFLLSASSWLLRAHTYRHFINNKGWALQ